MKKEKINFKYLLLLLLTISLLLISNICSSQTLKNKDVVLYGSYQPTDIGFGLRVDYPISYLRLYNSISYGDAGYYKINRLRQHTKITTGVFIPILNTDKWDKFYFTAGINYHSLSRSTINNMESIIEDTHLNPKIFYPWSFELGVTAYSWHNFAISYRTDILRWEPCLDIGYIF